LRWLMAVAATGGALVGLWLVRKRRTHGLSSPDHRAPESLFQGELGHKTTI
jgi:hypothetical protein